MSRKYIFIIIVLIILVAFLIKIKDSSSTQKPKHTNNQVATPVVTSHSLLRLLPQDLKPDSKGNVQMSVVLDTRDKDINAVQFELFYDPTSLKYIDIQPQGVFKNAQITKIEIHEKGAKCCHESGKITYGLNIDSKIVSRQQREDSPVAIVSFRALKHAWNTEVRFLKASVNSQDVKDAVYKSGYNTVINFEK